MPTRKRERDNRRAASLSFLLTSVASLAIVLALPPRPSEAQQLTRDESKCVQALGKDGAKVSKAEARLQQKCVKDASRAKLTGTADQCIADDAGGKVDKAESKTIADELKRCGDGSGFVPITGAETNTAAKEEALGHLADLVGATIDAGVAIGKGPAKCQQKIQKTLDKILAFKLKSFLRCVKDGADVAADLSAYELCLLDIPNDERVQKIVAKLTDTRSKSCAGVALDLTFPGNCPLSDPAQFDVCAEALAECRACSTIVRTFGLQTECDIFDNGLDDDSCADQPFCGDGNVDPGEECDPGAEPLCCSSTCTANADGLSCDDSAFCNGADQCQSGVCVHAGDPCSGGGECNATCNEAADDCFALAGTACTDDGNACTDDECDGAGTCDHANNTLPCDDGDACTESDTCTGGSCVGSAVDCDDGNPCTTDSCDSVLGCVNTPNSDPCDDGVFCNGADTCDAGSCSLHAGDPCAGGAECNDTCNEGAGDCLVPVATPCTDDGNECTYDVCDGAGACAHPFSTDPCTDDGNECTNDVCDGAGTCSHPFTTDPCTDDGNECTNDVCDGAGTCSHPFTTDPCTDDGNECTNDVCDGAGTCSHPFTTDPCTDDGNECTDDVCDGAGACSHPNNSDPCDDGDACTLGDTCSGGVCSGTGALDCDDANPCTTDSCDLLTGCVNTPNTDPCDDGNFCNGDDTCDGEGACAVHAGDPCAGGAECNAVCNETADNCFDLSGTSCTGDGNGCTDDICNGAGACTHPNNVAPCNDGLFCNGADMCSGGSCSVHAGDPCSGGGECADACNESADNCFDSSGTACTDDGNVCTDDACDGAGACAHPNNSASCDDGLFCNGADTCSGGSCSVHAGDPCAGGAQCADACNEGADNCFDLSGTVCDSGAPGANDNCDVNDDECDGAGACVNLDPAQIPEQCYTVGDEDCDGAADTADTDADSQCQGDGIETCTCADACVVGRVVPSAAGSTPLAALTPLGGEGSVSTSINSQTAYGTDTRTSLSYTLSGTSSNLDLWWSWTGNAGHTPQDGNGNISQFRFAAGESDAQAAPDRINEGPHTSQSHSATVAEFFRSDGLPIAYAPTCSSSTASSLEVRTTAGAGSWTTWGTPFPTSALAASIQSDVTTNLLNTRLVPITGSSFTGDYQLQLGGAAIGPQYEACNTTAPGTSGYGINLTAAIYGSYRNANVCP